MLWDMLSFLAVAAVGAVALLYVGYRLVRFAVYRRRPAWYNEAYEMAVDWYAGYVGQAKTPEQRHERFVEGEIIMQEMFHHIDCLFYWYGTKEEWRKMVGGDRDGFGKMLVCERKRLASISG